MIETRQFNSIITLALLFFCGFAFFFFKERRESIQSTSVGEQHSALFTPPPCWRLRGDLQFVDALCQCNWAKKCTWDNSCCRGDNVLGVCSVVRVEELKGYQAFTPHLFRHSVRNFSSVGVHLPSVPYSSASWEGLAHHLNLLESLMLFY